MTGWFHVLQPFAAVFRGLLKRWVSGLGFRVLGLGLMVFFYWFLAPVTRRRTGLQHLPRAIRSNGSRAW